MLLPELAAVAPEAGIDLSVGYLLEKGATPAAERLREAGVTPTPVGVRSLAPTAVRTVRRHLQQVAPDVVHTHLGYSDLLGGLAARSLKLPSVATLHQMRWDHARGREAVKELLMTEARRRATTRVVAVSQTVREVYLGDGRAGPDHVTVIHNGIRGVPEPGAGARVRAELGLAPDDVVVSMVSALRPEKQHGLAVEVVRRLRERDPRVKLLVAGDGPTRDEVAAAVASLDGGGVLAGYRSDVMAVLDATDVLLHPTTIDALPTTLIEAAAASVPVVATRVGGVREIVVEAGAGPETGVLFDHPAEAGAVAAALEGVVADPARRAQMGKAARRRFEDEFSAATWARRLHALYAELLGRSTLARR